MERRLGRSRGQITEEIRGTIQAISEARELVSKTASSKGTLNIFPTNELNWYFAACFRSPKTSTQMRAQSVLVLSVYSHSPGTRPWDMPAQQIHLDIHPQMQRWFEKELELLRAGVPPPHSRQLIGAPKATERET